MTTVICAAAILLCFTVGSHLISVAIAVARCRERTAHEPAPENAPAISLVRPVCGLDNFAESTLRSGFELDYPDYELIFCVAHARDPIVPTVQQLIAEYPLVSGSAPTPSSTTASKGGTPRHTTGSCSPTAMC
jgi:ceramide glucosyltransferase